MNYNYVEVYFRLIDYTPTITDKCCLNYSFYSKEGEKKVTFEKKRIEDLFTQIDLPSQTKDELSFGSKLHLAVYKDLFRQYHCPVEITKINLRNDKKWETIF